MLRAMVVKSNCRNPWTLPPPLKHYDSTGWDQKSIWASISGSPTINFTDRAHNRKPNYFIVIMNGYEGMAGG